MFISVSMLDLFCLLPYLLGGATETNAAQAPCVRSMPSRNSWSLQSLPCLFGKLRCRKVAIGRLLGEFVDLELRKVCFFLGCFVGKTYKRYGKKIYIEHFQS